MNKLTLNEIIIITKELREKTNEELEQIDSIDEFYKDGIYNGITLLRDIMKEAEDKNMNYKQIIKYIKEKEFFN